MKSLPFIFAFIIFLSLIIPAYGQNSRIVQSFDKIPINSSKYDVTSFMESELMDFTVKKEYKSDFFSDGIREAIKYEGVNFDEVTLIFYKGLLYHKQLDIFYIDNKYKVNAEREYENLNKHIRETYNILKRMESKSFNFGEQDGKGVSYNIKKIGNIFTANTGLMFIRLFDRKGTYGYKIEYTVIDVSKTEYDINKLSNPVLD